jgi:hypothetical protein
MADKSFQRAEAMTPLGTNLPDGVVPDSLPEGVLPDSGLPEGVVPEQTSTNMVNPAGHVVGVDPSQIGDALQRGYRHADAQDLLKHQREEQYGGVGQGALAALEGAASTATFGLSNKAESALGLTTPAAQLARKEEHPFLHGIGAVGGVALPLALTGGAAGPAEAAGAAAEAAPGIAETVAGLTAPALIARAGRAAAQGLGEAFPEAIGIPAGLVSGPVQAGQGIANALGAAAPAAASAALEGGLFGGEDVVERHFIGDPGLTAEKAMLEVGLSALIPGVLAGTGTLASEALAPFGDKLIAKGAAAAQQKAALEAEKEEASLVGAARERQANAYRQMERIEVALNNPATSAEDRASLLAFKATPEYADLVKANAASILTQAPEALASKEAAATNLSEFREQRPAMEAARAAELQDPTRLGNLVNERVIQRYGSRAVLGSLMGHIVGAPGGIGALGGISYGYMKDVIKRIVKDPAMYSTVGRFLSSPLETLSAMGGLSRYANATDEAIASGVGGIFGGGAKSATAQAVSTIDPKNFPDVQANLNDYNSNPDKLASEVSQQVGPLQVHAPATTANIHALASRVVQHLGQNLPQGGQKLFLDPAFEPSGTELAQLNRRMEIAERGPVAVLDHVRNGTLTSDHLRASEAMYPSLHQETLGKVAEALAAHVASGKPIPMQTRSGLSLLLGQPLDRAHTGAAIAASQALYAAQPAAPNPANAPPGKRVRATPETHFGSRLATDTQSNSSRMSDTA